MTPPRERHPPLGPRGPRYGPGYSVPVHHRLIGPIRPTRGHAATSRHSRLYAAPSLCGSALATREWFRAFAVRSLLACRPLCPRGTHRLHVPRCTLHRRHRPSPTYLGLGALECPTIHFRRGYYFGVSWFACGFHLRCGLSVCSPSWWIRPTHGYTPAPAHEDFYVCAFARSVTLPGGRYDYGAPWEDYTGGTFTR